MCQSLKDKSRKHLVSFLLYTGPVLQNEDIQNLTKGGTVSLQFLVGLGFGDAAHPLGALALLRRR